MRPVLSSTLRAALVAALFALGSFAGVSSAAAASPAVVSFDGTVVTVTGTRGVDYLVLAAVAGEFRVFRDGTIQAGPGCVQIEPELASCGTVGWPTVRATTSSGDDTVLVLGAPGGQIAGRIFVDTGRDDDDVTLDGGASRADITLGAGNDHADTFSAVPLQVNVEGGAGTDVLDGGPSAETLDGGSGNDTITGGDGDDVLNGDSGNDTIYGGGGRDLILGDYGTDRIDGGTDPDAIYGGYGNDTIVGGTGGGDELRGDSGADVITSNGPGSSLYGGEGNDSLNARNGVADRVISCGEGTSDKAKADPGELLVGCEKPLP